MGHDDTKTILPTNLRRICHVSEIAEGMMRGVEVGEKRLALYNVSGTFYVTDDRCTHINASLSKGTMEGDVITCPLHAGRFHIPTGRPLSPPVKVTICVYPVQVMDGEIYVQLAGNGTEQEQ